MAITDEQLRELHHYAEGLGVASRGGPPDTIRGVVVDTMECAARAGMRTEDEHRAPVHEMDLPDSQDRRDLYEAYQRGRTA